MGDNELVLVEQFLCFDVGGHIGFGLSVCACVSALHLHSVKNC